MALAPISVSGNASWCTRGWARPRGRWSGSTRRKQAGQVRNRAIMAPEDLAGCRRVAVAKRGRRWECGSVGAGHLRQRHSVTARPTLPALPCGLRMARRSPTSQSGGVYDIYVKPADGEGRTELFYRSALPNTLPTGLETVDNPVRVISPARSRTCGRSPRPTGSRACPGHDLLGSCRGALAGRKMAGVSIRPVGRNEVYVEPFEARRRNQARWLVSSAAAACALGGDGSEMFYMTSGGRHDAVSVHPAGGIPVDTAHILFQTRPFPVLELYDVSSDGQRFLLNLPLEWSSGAHHGG